MLITDVGINNKTVLNYRVKSIFYRLQVIVYADFSAKFPQNESMRFRISFNIPQNNDRMHLKDYEISHVVYDSTGLKDALTEFFNSMVSNEEPYH